MRDFRECIAAEVPFLLAEQVGQGGIGGYAVAYKAADEGEILNLGVAPAHRRRGVGRSLVDRLLAVLAREGARSVYLEVRESNAGARLLYETAGFKEVGRRAGYYNKPVEDAIVLRAAVSAENDVA